MGLDLRQTLSLSQQLVMTPQLQQAIKLLQLNRLELADLLQEELTQNPVLEEETDIAEADAKKELTSDKTEEVKGEGEGANEFDWESYIQNSGASSNTGTTVINRNEEMPSIESTLSKESTLTDHLKWQLGFALSEGKEKIVGELIIGNLNEDGYFLGSLEDIASKVDVDMNRVESVLSKIQQFDPSGVAARDLKECLTIQSKNMIEGDLAREIIANHLSDLEVRNYKAIQKSMGLPMSKVLNLVKRISELEPKPGRPFFEANSNYITPDIYVYKVNGEYVIALNEDGMPKLRISNYYKSVLGNTMGATNDVAKEYIHEKLRSAMWLIRSIHQRQRTIYKVTESILKLQGGFFEEGISKLKPMVLRDVAQDIDMHESTISRVTANKYVHTPQGIYELKYFFNSSIRKEGGESIASESVKDKIKQIVSGENTAKPFSDQDIVNVLKESNIKIARRTVAKYREMLGILPSSKRKRMF